MMITYSIQLQYNFPPESHLNKEFFKKLLKGEKQAYKVTEVQNIIVPKVDELSINKMLNMIKSDKQLMQYLPDEYYKKLTPDR